MSPSIKSNIHRRVPSARQSGRVDLFARAINVPGVLEIGSYHHQSAQRGLTGVAHAGCLGVCFLARGVQTYRIDDRLYQMQGGDQLVTFPGDCLDTADAPEEKGRLHWILIRMQPLDAPLLFLERPAAIALRQALLVLPERHFPAPREAAELSSAILNTLVRRPVALLDRIAAANLVLRYLFATLHAGRADIGVGVSPRIQRCLAHMAAHIREPLYVSAVAQAVGLSESRFKARFRQEVGLPPGEYILRAKIAAACTELRRPGSRITDLAHALGFSSSQYFATVFRRFTGLAPRAYQRREQIVG
jgi:AraC-like DNA-binding protein